MLLTDRRQLVELRYTGEQKDPATGQVRRAALPPEQQATFSCRLLTGSEFLRVMDGGAGGTSMLNAVKWCLKGWAGIVGADGDPVPFPGSATEAIEQLPGDVVAWLGAEIMQTSTLQRADLGK